MTRRRPPGADARSRLTGRGWIAGAVLVVVLGTIGSVFAARVVARNDREDSRRTLVASSAELTSRVRLAIQHEQDLVISTSAFIFANPNISNTTFNHWLQADRAFARYPEILG